MSHVSPLVIALHRFEGQHMVTSHYRHIRYEMAYTPGDIMLTAHYAIETEGSGRSVLVTILYSVSLFVAIGAHTAECHFLPRELRRVVTNITTIPIPRYDTNW